jgi:hypothetical protein
VKTIEITVDTKGQATVRTSGFTGASCRDATRLLERALGERQGEQLTEEFYQAQASREQARQA